MPPQFFGLIWLGMLGVAWYQALSTPHRIDVSEAGRIEFGSVLRKRVVEALEIESIKPGSSASVISRAVTAQVRGKVTLVNRSIDGFHEFIADLKDRNPNVPVARVLSRASG